MKDTIKITVIAAGFKDANKKNVQPRQTLIPRAWKTGPEFPELPPNWCSRLSRMSSTRKKKLFLSLRHEVRHEVRREVPADDLEIPTFMRRQAQKA